MANDANTQQALAADPRFQLRVKNALASVAWQVLNETPPANHAARAAYARLVLSDLNSYAAEIAGSLVTRPNVMNFVTSYDFVELAVVTTSGDADLQSQLATDWNNMAGA